MRTIHRRASFALAFLAAWVATTEPRAEANVRVWHYAANGNFDATGTFTPAKSGFDLADVKSRHELDLLPDGTRGLIWIGQCEGATEKFKMAVNAVIDHPKAFGFYLMDDPDPTGVWRPRCSASNLREESDWIHRRKRGLITFVALMNVGTSSAPKFSVEYAPTASHVDLFGVAPYPCRTGWSDCDFSMVDRFVAASRNAGFPLSRVVPTFQVFGGEAWRADEGGEYRLPSPAELQLILERWRNFTARPAFDFAYSWGQQRSDASLSGSADLQKVFARHNRDSRPTKDATTKRRHTRRPPTRAVSH